MAKIKKGHDGMLMGRESLTLFKELIQSIKSEQGIDVGDDDGFDMLNQFYLNCVEYYNEMATEDGGEYRFYASTKKSKMKKTPIINLYGYDDDDTRREIEFYDSGADVTAQEIEALAPSAEVIVDMGQIDVIWRLPSGNHPGLWITSHGKGRQGVHVTANHFDYPDDENVSGFLDYIQDKYGRKSYELVNSGSGLPAEEIKDAIREMENELGKYALQTKMPLYNASTKKSKKVKKGLSWIEPAPIYHKMWERFVPSTGKADTDFGETLRCASRVIYRFYNDGDKYNVGYGRETVNPALDWLADSCPYPNVSQVAQNLRQFMNDNVQHYDAFENSYGEIEEPEEDYFDASEEDYQDFLIDLNEAVTDICYQKEKELDSEAEDRSYYASTRKSKINKTMSFEDNVNKMRKSNYAKTGNINTIIKERR